MSAPTAPFLEFSPVLLQRSPAAMAIWCSTCLAGSSLTRGCYAIHRRPRSVGTTAWTMCTHWTWRACAGCRRWRPWVPSTTRTVRRRAKLACRSSAAVCRRRATSTTCACTASGSTCSAATGRASCSTCTSRATGTLPATRTAGSTRRSAGTTSCSSWTCARSSGATRAPPARSPPRVRPVPRVWCATSGSSSAVATCTRASTTSTSWTSTPSCGRGTRNLLLVIVWLLYRCCTVGGVIAYHWLEWVECRGSQARSHNHMMRGMNFVLADSSSRARRAHRRARGPRWRFSRTTRRRALALLRATSSRRSGVELGLWAARCCCTAGSRRAKTRSATAGCSRRVARVRRAAAATGARCSSERPSALLRVRVRARAKRLWRVRRGGRRAWWRRRRAWRPRAAASRASGTRAARCAPGPRSPARSPSSPSSAAASTASSAPIRSCVLARSTESAGFRACVYFLIWLIFSFHCSLPIQLFSTDSHLRRYRGNLRFVIMIWYNN